MKNRISTFITAIAILLFCSTSLVAQQTKVNFNKSGEPVFQTTTAEIDSVIFKQLDELFIVDISEETDWDLLITGIDNNNVLVNIDENSDILTQLYYKPDSNSDYGLSIFFNNDGLPQMAVINDCIFYFGNFRDTLFDFALIYSDSTIEYFYDISTPVDWNDFLDSSNMSTKAWNPFKNIQTLGNNIINSFKVVSSTLIEAIPSMVEILDDALGFTSISGAITTSIGVIDKFWPGVIPSDVVNVASFFSDIGVGIACATAFTNPISALSCIVGVSNMTLNPSNNPIEDAITDYIKNGTGTYAPILSQASAHLNVYLNGGILYLDANGMSQVLQDSVPVLVYTNQTILGIAGKTTWVNVSGTQVANGRITVLGDVRLILSDSCYLNASNGGINVTGNNKLTIYAQSIGSNVGILTAKGSARNAGIGGNTNESGGIITINGGRVTSTGANGSGKDGGGAGIGGGGGQHSGTLNNGGNGGFITINGGTVTSTGGNAGNGAGGGDIFQSSAGGNGGGGAGAGIGGGGGCGRGQASGGVVGGDGGVITINGGTVTSTNGKFGNGGSSNAGCGGGGGGAGAAIGGGGGSGGGGRGHHTTTSATIGSKGSDIFNPIGNGAAGGTGGGNGNGSGVNGGAGGAAANYVNNGGTVVTQ